MAEPWDGSRGNPVASGEGDDSERPSRERRRPAYLRGYVDGPGSRKNLRLVKNRRQTFRASFAKKTHMAREALGVKGNGKLLELLAQPLRQAWVQLRDNHREFQELCEDGGELQESDTWLLEVQESFEEFECELLKYHEESEAREERSEHVTWRDAVTAAVLPRLGAERRMRAMQRLLVEARVNAVERVHHALLTRSKVRLAGRKADLARMKLEQVKESFFQPARQSSTCRRPVWMRRFLSGKPNRRLRGSRKKRGSYKKTLRPWRRVQRLNS